MHIRKLLDNGRKRVNQQHKVISNNYAYKYKFQSKQTFVIVYK